MTTNRYLVALVDGGGTVPVELGVVRRLVDGGHDVTVLAEDSMAAEVQATGAAFRRWASAPNRPDRRPEHDPYRDWECTNPRQPFARLLEAQFAGPLRSYADDVDAAIADDRPDLVLCSMFSFDVLVPNAYLFPVDGATPFGLGLRPGCWVAVGTASCGAPRIACGTRACLDSTPCAASESSTRCATSWISPSTLGASWC